MSDEEVRTSFPTDEPLVLPGHGREVWSVAFDDDGSRIATASYDGRARIWDVSSGQMLGTLDDHANILHSVEFLTGNRVVTGAGDGVMRVWSTDGGELPIVLRGHQGAIVALAGVPGTQRLLSVSRDGAVILWDLSTLSFDPEIVLERLRAATRYCLSAEQRQRELGEDPEQARIAAHACL